MDQHQKNQQEAIAEVLSELLSSRDDCDLAHRAIVGAIDDWLAYYEQEARKWRALRGKIADVPQDDNGRLVEF